MTWERSERYSTYVFADSNAVAVGDNTWRHLGGVMVDVAGGRAELVSWSVGFLGSASDMDNPIQLELWAVDGGSSVVELEPLDAQHGPAARFVIKTASSSTFTNRLESYRFRMSGPALDRSYPLGRRPVMVHGTTSDGLAFRWRHNNGTIGTTASFTMVVREL